VAVPLTLPVEALMVRPGGSSAAVPGVALGR